MSNNHIFVFWLAYSELDMAQHYFLILFDEADAMCCKIFHYTQKYPQGFEYIQGMSKAKHQKEGSRKKQVTVCPNCKFHFRSNQIVNPPSDQKTSLIYDNLMLQSYENVSLQNSRERVLNRKEFETRKLQEHQLIQQLKIGQLSKIEKLKKLTDLNQLKKSKLMESRSAMLQNLYLQSPQKVPPSVQHKPLEAKELSAQKQQQNRYKIKQWQKSPKMGKQQQNSPEKQLQKFPKIESELKQSRLSFQKDSKMLTKEILDKKVIEQTLNCLLEWIQNFGLQHTLPSFLKEMLQDYRNEYQTKQELNEQLKMLPKG